MKKKRKINSDEDVVSRENEEALMLKSKKKRTRKYDSDEGPISKDEQMALMLK